MKTEYHQSYIDRAQQSKENALARLEEELNAYQRAGCILKLNGRRCYPKRVAESCVREKGSYMRDILYDDASKVREINFIRLREETEDKQVRHKTKKNNQKQQTKREKENMR